MFTVNRIAPTLALVMSFLTILLVGQVREAFVGGGGSEQSASTSAVQPSDLDVGKSGHADDNLPGSAVPHTGGVDSDDVDSGGRDSTGPAPDRPAETPRPAPTRAVRDEEHTAEPAGPVQRPVGPQVEG